MFLRSNVQTHCQSIRSSFCYFLVRYYASGLEDAFHIMYLKNLFAISHLFSLLIILSKSTTALSIARSKSSLEQRDGPQNQ